MDAAGLIHQVPCLLQVGVLPTVSRCIRTSPFTCHFFIVVIVNVVVHMPVVSASHCGAAAVAVVEYPVGAVVIEYVIVNIAGGICISRSVTPCKTVILAHIITDHICVVVSHHKHKAHRRVMAVVILEDSTCTPVITVIGTAVLIVSRSVKALVIAE